MGTDAKKKPARGRFNEPVSKPVAKKTPIKSGVPGIPPASKKALAKRVKK